jgi:hypothetical protein
MDTIAKRTRIGLPATIADRSTEPAIANSRQIGQNE